MWPRRLFPCLIAVGLFGLTACDVPAPVDPPPVVTPAHRPHPPAPSKTVLPRTEESLAISRHFGQVQADFQTRGLLRTDDGRNDLPFSTRNLVDTFIQVALYSEYSGSGGRLTAQKTESPLRRWETPIRIKVAFGPSVPLAQRIKDRARIAHYIKRLSRLTRLSIQLSNSNPNFHVLILNENERRTAGPLLMHLEPQITPVTTRAITDMSRATFCVVSTFDKSTKPSSMTSAISVIRAEHPDLLRLACVHEELAQGLGLPNDSPQARPSIFNDDEEFGLLTHHDELLLRILYDPRLRPGMTAKQARPIVEIIAAELLGSAA